MPAQLHFFADGSLFSYAVAAGDAWDFHWRQIAVRVAAFALASLPGQEFGLAFGDPAGGVAVYAALLFLAPGLGLAACWIADRTQVIRLWAAASVALLCPVVFGFPTELWITHAAVWVALALLWSPDGTGRWVAGSAALAVVVLSHEAGMVWAGVLLGVLALAPQRGLVLRRAAVGLAPSLAVWAALKMTVRPDPYVAEVLGRNAWNLFRLDSLGAPLLLTMGGGLAVYGLALALRLRPHMAAAIAGCVLAGWWTGFDTALHAWDRYYLRTLLLGAVPGLMLLAALHAAGRVRFHGMAPTAAGALLVVTLVHGVETVKFVVAWRFYVAEVRRLAMGEASDPGLGDARFVSAARIPARYAPLSWHSTTPFLSVLVSEGYAPQRLVVDPGAGYFWFDCAAAAANAAAVRAFPVAAREMVRSYACLHR